MSSRSKVNTPDAYKSRTELVKDIENILHYTRWLERQLNSIAEVAKAGNIFGARRATLIEITARATEHQKTETPTNQKEQQP